MNRILGLVIATAILAAGIAVLSPEASAYSSPAIWVGSPVAGTWGKPGDASTTPAGGHHKLYKASPQNDWAGDLSSISSADRNVVLYVAPSNSAFNNAVTTRITQIVDNNACRNGGGGDFVTVGIYYNGTLYGHATYVHLDRDPSLYVGKPVSRWGTVLGRVAWLPESDAPTGGSGCWTGPHVHFELRATTQYACWNKGYSYAGYPLGRTNFLGFISGPLASSARACP